MSEVLSIIIPKDWKIIKFKEAIQNVKRGESKKTNNQKKGVRYLTSDYLQEGRINWGIQKYLITDKDIKPYLLEKNDLIINCVNSFAKVGKAALFEGHNEPVVIGFNNFAVKIDSTKIHPKYLVYFFTSKIGYSEIVRIIKPAINQVSFSSKDLNIIKIILPPLDEQRRIVSILENMDNLIQTTQQLIEKLHECKKGLMQRLFTEGIGHTEFKNSKLGRIPKKWEYPKIKTIAKVIGGGTPSTTNEDYWNGNILWLTPTEITNLQKKYISDTERKITDLGLQNSSARIIPEHSLILTSRATIGACAINTVPLATNQGFQNLIPNERVLIDYLYYYFSYTSFQNLMKRYANGSTFLEISNKSVQNLQIPLPSLNEQEKITSILDQVHFQIINNNKFKSKMKLIKKGLMQILLTGKKRVP